MKNIKVEQVLGIILAILVVVMIIVILLNGGNETISASTEEIQAQLSQENNVEEVPEYLDNEKAKSMTEGNLICKIDNQTIFAQGKDIYLINEEEKQKNKLATLDIIIDKMYFDGQNIFCIPEYNQGTGIYKIDMQGNVNKIYNGVTLQICLTDNNIYFVNQIGYDSINKNPQGTLCMMDKNGENMKQIASSIKNYFYIQNDKVYYTTQTRQMYQMNLDGTSPELIQEGRKFTLGVNGKYLIYIDYANQEVTQLYNLETKEEKNLGMSGVFYQFLNNTYVVLETTSETLNVEYTILELDVNTGETMEVFKSGEIGKNIKYIEENKIYYEKEDQTLGIINTDTGEQETNQDINNSSYFISGCAYRFDDQTQKIVKVNLATNEKVEI